MVKEKGGTAFSYVCDVTNIDNVKQVAAQTRRDLGDVDIVVCELHSGGLGLCYQVLSLGHKANV